MLDTKHQREVERQARLDEWWDETRKKQGFPFGVLLTDLIALRANGVRPYDHSDPELAYDLDTQRWVAGEPARLLLISQAIATIKLIQHPNYGWYSEATDWHREGDIELLEAQIAELERHGTRKGEPA